MAHLYGYARVSTNDQDPALQHDALAAAGCARIFTDVASGKLDRRPELAKLLDAVLPGDTIVVWRLDRLGRSIAHLIEVITELGERGVAFRSLAEAIDTTTAGGRLLFHVMGSLAEFERQLIVERTQAGLTAARARGRVGGRPRAMSAKQVTLARELYESKEHTVSEIAKMLGVSRTTVYSHVGTRENRASTAEGVQRVSLSASAILLGVCCFAQMFKPTPRQREKTSISK